LDAVFDAEAEDLVELRWTHGLKFTLRSRSLQSVRITPNRLRLNAAGAGLFVGDLENIIESKCFEHIVLRLTEAAG
jgi:hypothetical protein